jgi:prophage maintenance system killer protein
MISKFKFLVVAFLISINLQAQEDSPTKQFWEKLQTHCNKTYEGTLELPKGDDPFRGKKLVMHVRSCTNKTIKIPFFVGEDRSRTWILKYKNDRISLKHDHRHKDGSEDDINFYGGITTNPGQAGIQIFSADERTQRMIPAASTNVWWITLNDSTFTYNLRRLGTDRVFKVVMDVTSPKPTAEAPWGWKEKVDYSNDSIVIKGGKDLYKRIDNVVEIITGINKKYDVGKELHPGQLASSINSASYYEKTADQGSSIFYSLVTGHVFENGVKRTARDFIIHFAKSNNLILKLKPKKIKKLAIKLAIPVKDGGLRFENGIEGLHSTRMG